MSTLASVIVRDLLANRPVAGIAGRLFFASDTNQFFRDNGASWDENLADLAFGVNKQTVTTYTILASDQGKLVTFLNALAIAVTLPQAGTSSFISGFMFFLENRGAGTLTLTPTVSTIDGATSLALAQNQGVMVVSDGTNWFTMRGIGGGGGGGSTTATLVGNRKRTQVYGGLPPSGNEQNQGDSFNVMGSRFNGYEAPTAGRGPATSYFNSVANTAIGGFGAAQYRTGKNIQFFGEIYIGRTTDIRIWCGVTSNLATSTGTSDTPTGSYAMFRFSTIAGDTQIQCITSDGTTQNIISSGITPDTNSHRFLIVFNDSAPSIAFYIDDSLVATSTLHLPAASTNLGYYFSALWAVSSAAPAIGLSTVIVQSDL